MSKIVLAPFKYIECLPSKGVRNILIDALNVWFKVPEASCNTIREVVALLHTSSLMQANYHPKYPPKFTTCRFDDIEDGSALRRGKPATHKVFGIAQTINSSTYILLSSIAKARTLCNPECTNILVGKFRNLLLSSRILLICATRRGVQNARRSRHGSLFYIFAGMSTRARISGDGRSQYISHLNLFWAHLLIREQRLEDYSRLLIFLCEQSRWRNRKFYTLHFPNH